MARDVNVRSEEDLLEFAKGLDGLSEAMVENFHRALDEMQRINEGWNDIQSQRFMEEFSKKVNVIENIALAMKEYSRYITRYAEQVQNIKNLR